MCSLGWGFQIRVFHFTFTTTTLSSPLLIMQGNNLHKKMCSLFYLQFGWTERGQRPLFCFSAPITKICSKDTNTNFCCYTMYWKPDSMAVRTKAQQRERKNIFPCVYVVGPCYFYKNL